MVEKQQKPEVIRHSELIVTDGNGSKLRTKSQKFDLQEGVNVRGVSQRAPRMTEKFENLRSGEKVESSNLKSNVQEKPVQ